ncbi:hypothetical protein K474DRAFT_1675251 [Panus rudis PR-1116 ss-1]|nr:hypothetical protein K474DRAFT_1675251 [Panus rudis PR-1116 ss-1]
MPSRFYRSTGMLHPRQDDKSILLGPGGQIIASNDGDTANGISAAAIQQFQTKAVEPESMVSQTWAPVASLAQSLVPVSMSTIVSLASASQLTSSLLPSSQIIASPTTVLLATTSVVSTSTISTSSATPAPSSVTLTEAPTSSTQVTSSDAPVATSSSSSADSEVSQLDSSTSESNKNPDPDDKSSLGDKYRHEAKYFGAILGALVFIGLCYLTLYLVLRRRKRRAAAAKKAPNWDPARNEKYLERGKVKGWEKFGDVSPRGGQVKGLYDGPYPAGMYGTTSTISQPHSAYNSPMVNGHPQYPYGTPFRTVPALHPQQSVPDLAPDFGKLKVANYMPGDNGSLDSASRANSRMGKTGPSEYGSPHPGMASDRPRFLGLDGGLDVPWDNPSMRVNMNRERIEFDHVQRSPYPRSERDIPNLPYPDTNTNREGGPPTHDQEGWASSIRSTLVNAFHTVAGSGASSSTAHDENLTNAPSRQSRRSIQSQPLENPFMSPHSLHRDGHEDWEDLSAHLHNGNNGVVLPEQPPVAVVHSRDRAAPSMSRSSSYSDSSVVIAPTRSQEPSVLPQIPAFSPISRTPGVGHAKRPNAARHMSSAAVSVASEMSRTMSSTTEDGVGLTEEEQFAKMMLQERRKRIMAHSAGRSA